MPFLRLISRFFFLVLHRTPTNKYVGYASQHCLVEGRPRALIVSCYCSTTTGVCYGALSIRLPTACLPACFLQLFLPSQRNPCLSLDGSGYLGIASWASPAGPAGPANLIVVQRRCETLLEYHRSFLAVDAICAMLPLHVHVV